MSVCSYGEKFEKYSLFKATQQWDRFKNYIEFPELTNEICLMLLKNRVLHKDRTDNIPHHLDMLLVYYKRNRLETIQLKGNSFYNNIDTYINNTYFDFIKNYINKTFTQRDKYILYSRYGIECDKMTLEEIGKTLNITRERVRQIEVKLLDQLKNYLLKCEEELL